MGILGKGMLEGMVVTARNFFGSYFDHGRKERLFTIQYPEERMELPENTRTFPFLVCDDGQDPVGTIRCTACKICETECPPQCIYIVMDRDDKGKPRQRPKVFDIDLSVCMQCQICVEVCPFDAIKMDNDFEHSKAGRFEPLVTRLPDLLKPNAYYREVKPTEAAEVDARLKVEREKKAKKAATAAAPKPAAAPAVPAAPPAPKPATVTLKVTIPEDAPFNPEQRAWLQGFLSGVNVAAVAVPAPASAVGTPAPAAKPVTETAAGPAPAPAAAAPPAPSAGDWPWHDAGMNMQQRMDLAKDRPLADKLMAAMAQTDCHACGYDCRGYADAIASGAESDTSLCLPGEAETANMLKKLLQEAGKP